MLKNNKIETSSIQHWRKVYELDLTNLVSEMKEGLSVPSVIILTGAVGAGKTTFTKAFTELKEVTSPTYAMIQDAGKTVHADFYRLENADEIIHLEIPLYLEEKDFFLVEWGKEYFRALDREVPDEFTFYELTIEVNGPSETDSDGPSRNYSLKKLER